MDKKDRDTTGMKPMPEGKKNIRIGKRNRLVFLAEWFVLVIFISAAFFLPQGIFHMQDSILYGRTMLSAREKIDVETLSTTYERSLPLRMLHFAECLEAGDNFYVTSKEMPVTQEVYDYLYSDSLLYEGIASHFAAMGLLSTELVWEEGTVNQWKQYVIYSDDYTKGVNFILWYIELQDSEGEILKILADAETEVIYAMKEENSYHLQYWAMGDYDSRDGLSCYWHLGVEMWNVLAQYYEAITQEDIDSLYEKYGDMTDKELWELIEKMEPDKSKDRYLLEYYYGLDSRRNRSAFWEDKSEDYSEEINILCFQLFYDETPFDVIIDLREVDIEFVPYYKDFYISPDITMGFPQIYELIPEFH